MTSQFNSRQLMFQELFIGTLIYVVVLGLWNDYTAIVEAKSFSAILFGAIVLEILTFLAMWLKKYIITGLKDRSGAVARLLMFFCVWLVMFVSKFVFVAVLDLIFGSYLMVNGFVGILLVVACVTIIHRLSSAVFARLGAT